MRKTSDKINRRSYTSLSLLRRELTGFQKVKIGGVLLEAGWGGGPRGGAGWRAQEIQTMVSSLRRGEEESAKASIYWEPIAFYRFLNLFMLSSQQLFEEREAHRGSL